MSCTRPLCRRTRTLRRVLAVAAHTTRVPNLTQPSPGPQNRARQWPVVGGHLGGICVLCRGSDLERMKEVGNR